MHLVGQSEAQLHIIDFLVGRVGLEPTTKGL